MSVSAPCEICTHGEAEHSCLRCGKLVCDKHFDTTTELCDECTAEVGESPDEIPDEDDLPDDVDTYRF